MIAHMIVSLVVLAAQDAPPATHGPAPATPAPAAAPATPPAPPAPAAPPATSPPKVKCELVQHIGSRIPVRICMTEQQRNEAEQESRELLRRSSMMPDGRGG